MRQVFSVLAHGSLQTTAPLTHHRQQVQIPIVSLGTQGNGGGSTLIWIGYLLQVHGVVFMNELFSILQRYGETYYTEFVPDKTSPLQQDIHFLFQIHQEERKKFPHNQLRSYTGTDTILNLSLGMNQPNETLFLDGVLLEKNHFVITKNMMVSSPLPYSMVHYTLFQKQYFKLIHPLGIFKFHEKQKTISLDQSLSFPNRYLLRDILQYIHAQSKLPIVFLIHMDVEHKKQPAHVIQELSRSPTKTTSSCFHHDIHVLDEPVNTPLLHRRDHSRIINMLKTCFPLTKKSITYKNYFHSPSFQRIVCLYQWEPPKMRERNIMAVCFVQQQNKDQLFIHSVCVEKKYQGKRCCDRLFSHLVGTYGKMYELSLYVRVDKYKTQGLPVNTPAIQCYRKAGFLFVDEPCSIQNDGLNCRMIRQKTCLTEN